MTKHICGDPNSPCDMDCMGKAYSYLEGEVLEKACGIFFVHFKGKNFEFFSSREGAQAFLEVLRKNSDSF